VVSENEWGSTTEQLLYWVDGGDRKSRLSVEEFEKRLEELLAKYSLLITPPYLDRWNQEARHELEESARGR